MGRFLASVLWKRVGDPKLITTMCVVSCPCYLILICGYLQPHDVVLFGQCEGRLPTGHGIIVLKLEMFNMKYDLA